ncbi:phage head morphogenesis protein [Ornithobacterium rhinotracheale]|nr:phage head morphogenesis protein [Ornithobacterium rhinotracheale]
MSRLIEDYIREVFEERKVSEAQREALWEYYYQQLSSAVDLGYSPALEHYSEDLAFSLKRNIAEFSAFKETSFRKQLEASLTENGRVLSWQEFKQKADDLNIEYNRRWLKTEYDQTIATATQAGKYQEYLANKHLYPNLKYKTIGDERVREKHKQWDELILPVEHPFWKTHLPPNDWGCRCYVVPTDEEPNREIQKGEPLKETFANNPALSGKIFPTSGYLTFGGLNPETIEKIIDWSHEMFKKVSSSAKRLYRNRILKKPREKQFNRIFKGADGGKVLIHKLARKGNDYNDILNAAKAFAKEGKVAEILPEIDAENKIARSLIFPNLDSDTSNPDLRVNGIFYDIKRPKALKNILGNAHKSSNQGAIVITSDSQMDKGITKNNVSKQLKLIFNSKHYKYDSAGFLIKGKLTLYNRTGDKL